MISRKHFQMIADALKGQKPPLNIALSKDYGARLVQWEHDVLAVANALKLMNPRFDMDRFVEACNFYKDKAA